MAPNKDLHIPILVIFNSLLTLEMQRFLATVTEAVVSGPGWKKFVKPTVGRGNTAWPRSPDEQQRHGVRYDFDKEVTRDGKVYNKFQMQPNAGKVPSVIKTWREKAPRGTHSVMAEVLVPKDGNEEDVEKALNDAHKDI
ncbi:hypothetical protein CVT24_011990 [Panaeolus cyanescens]|uniref:Uncharacterized protein n=1 Tax=Panaeolus cyanescens TaxID=181874 RepID=A0A409WX56_9AGAR|nr:hypothetical protein CVT24_011990 [Panaeolus cyanescens]